MSTLETKNFIIASKVKKIIYELSNMLEVIPKRFYFQKNKLLGYAYDLLESIYIINYYDIRNIYNQEIEKKVRNRKRIYAFEKKKEQYLLHMYDELSRGTYDGGKYNLFLIYKPKIRVIMSQNIYDKTINHYVTKHILEPKLSHLLEYFNVATRKDMGTSKGINILKKCIERNKKYNKFYFLKLDIKKYFYNIDHDVLKDLLKQYLDNDEYKLIAKIIDSTDRDYINDTIVKLGSDLPIYRFGKGLPIGSLSSQYLAIFYLHKLHHFIVHDLHIKDIVVYMDDYILIHNDREYLKKVLKIIEFKLNNEYKLELNKSKTHITSCSTGVVFLGYHFKIINKKTIITLTTSAKKHIRDSVKKNRYMYKSGLCNFQTAFSSINTIKYSYKYTKSKYIENSLDKYWYN